MWSSADCQRVLGEEVKKYNFRWETEKVVKGI